MIRNNSNLDNMVMAAAFFILLSAHVIHANEDISVEENSKPRRASYNSGRIYSLYPFPRNGRSDPEFAKFNRITQISRDEIDKIGDLDYIKPKRAYAGIQGLKPFPRTGRSDPELANWDNVVNSINAFDDDYEGAEYTPLELKRAQNAMFAFPRVGRGGGSRFISKASDTSQETIKRGGVGAGSGMWFGPRLGRVQKRSTNSDHIA